MNYLHNDIHVLGSCSLSHGIILIKHEPVTYDASQYYAVDLLHPGYPTTLLLYHQYAPLGGLLDERCGTLAIGYAPGGIR